jgi:transporter family-2 protein
VLPWWALTGGLLGAAYVVSTLMSVPAIGAGGVAAASIAGGLAFGAVADTFGMFGLERIPLDAARLAGLAILAFGAALVLRRPQQKPGP